jgi:tRNA dimethylallyltransferase
MCSALSTVSNTSDRTIIIAGPTASGKSALAMMIARAFNGAIINADSMQVYHDLSILTARPSDKDALHIPHELYGVLDAAERCSAGRWLGMAANAIEETRAKGLLPIFVGGTGLYLHVLTSGLAPLPEIPNNIRKEAAALHAQIGGEEFRDRLVAVDPEAAARIPATDSQRLKRAWEVAQATGRPLTAWQIENTVNKAPLGQHAAVVVMPPREAVYAACNDRFDHMIDDGAIDEVRRIRDLNLAADLPAMKAFGVPQLSRHLAGESSLEDAIAATKQATRNYVRRQFTWLHHHKISDTSYLTQYPERELKKILSFIRQFLLTKPN